FDFWFDGLVDSLTLAAAKAGYAPAGHWFPWEAYRAAEGKAKEKCCGTSEAKAAPDESTLFEAYPAVMLFRWYNSTATSNAKAAGQAPGSVSRTLVLLLVSETPNGIRGRALRQALDLSQELDRGRGRSKPEPIRVVAPYFSGAQTSFARALGEWTKAR